MAWDEERGRGVRLVSVIIIILLLAFLGGVVYLRLSPGNIHFRDAGKAEPTPVQQPTEEPAPEETEEAVLPEEAAEEPLDEPETPDEEEQAAEPAEEPAEAPAEAPEEEPAEEPEESDPLEYRPIRYDQRSYQLVTDMVYAYKKQVPNMDAIIASDVAALTEHDERLGKAWGSIMEYWSYSNKDMELNKEKLPDDLASDESLCIVVLGFQLGPKGEMSQELEGRCKLALNAAQQYPRAYVLVTGGGTALSNSDVTEAGVMAEWFKEQGIDEKRLILEDRSLTTDQNATYSLEILTRDYPKIRHLVIVSSTYHVPMGCLMFTEAAQLYGCEYGKVPFDVVSNLAFEATGLPEYTEPEGQGLYLWALARPGM